MSNYRYINFSYKIGVNRFESYLQQLATTYLLKVDRCDADPNDYIFTIEPLPMYHKDNLDFSFQIWYMKGLDGKAKVTYHPNIQHPIITLIEEALAMKIADAFDGEIEYEC